MDQESINYAENVIKREFTKTSPLNKIICSALFKDDQFLAYAERVSQGRMIEDAIDNIEDLILAEVDLPFISSLVVVHLKYRMGADIKESATYAEEAIDEDSND